MISFGYITLGGFLFVLAAGGVLRGDQISLTGEGRLSGTVRSINNEGVVELVSPLANESLFLKAEAVKSVKFGREDTGEGVPTARVELQNGDILPIEIETLDDRQLMAMSPVAGKLTIPRESLKTLSFGIYPNQVIYPKNKSIEDMKPEGAGEDNWSYDDHSWSVEGLGRLTKKLEPLDQFSAKFTLEWDGNLSFQFSFADPLLPHGQISDRYYFQFGSGGIEVIREASKEKRRKTTLFSLNRRPEQFTDHRLKVEIRVDRTRSLLYLFINGEPEGRFSDPYGVLPTGGGIAFSSTEGDESHLNITSVEISKWNPHGDRHRSEDRGDSKLDSLIERQGERFGGSLLSIQPSSTGPIFRFKSDFQNSPIELPETEVSTIFFKERDKKMGDEVNPFVLRLRGHGILRVSSCSFSGDRIDVTHRLLGQLSLERDGVTALERLTKKGEAP